MLRTRIKNRLIRRGIVVLALLATLQSAPVEAGQTFDEAVAAYGRGDYATAVRGFIVHAEQGYASAQFNLGLMYVNGRGVLKDDTEAREAGTGKAAEQGHADRPIQPRSHVRQRASGVRNNEAEAGATGSSWLPSRASPKPNTASVSCTPPARMSSRTRLKL